VVLRSGLLFNELQCAPQGILNALSQMAEHALELDTGRYNPTTSAIILYVVRLLVRVEGFMIFLVKHHMAEEEGKITPHVSGTGHNSFVRGLECTPEQVLLPTTFNKSPPLTCLFFFLNRFVY
jgi:hypothetical protein